MVVLPWTYTGKEDLVGAEAGVSGEHVVEAVGPGEQRDRLRVPKLVGQVRSREHRRVDVNEHSAPVSQQLLEDRPDAPHRVHGSPSVSSWHRDSGEDAAVDNNTITATQIITEAGRS